MTNKPVPTYYVFHGKNSFERENDVRVMKARMGKGAEADLNIRVFRDSDFTLADALNDVSTYPFLSDKRLVIVYGLLTALTRKGAGKDAKADLERLIAVLPKLPEYARLVFVEADELSSSHPVMKLQETDTHGYVKLFSAPKNVAEWIARRAIAYSAEIEPRAASLLAAMLGDVDLHAVDSEVAKLADYVRADPAGARAINEADVRLLTVNIAETKIWDLTDALGLRNPKQAATIAHKILDDGGEPMAVLGSIYSHFRKLMIVKAFEAEGVNGNLSEALNGAQNFTINKLREQARQFKYTELESIHHLLLETDFQIKSGGFGGTAEQGVLPLDLLIATLTA